MTPTEQTLTEQAVFDALYGRRSIRRYVEGKPVEPEKIDKLLKAAMAAPSACNLQPWEFIVVTDPDLLARVKASIDMWGGYNAPLIIVTCGDPSRIPWGNDNGIVDCAAATENLLTAAYALGLGSVWCGGFDRDRIREILEIPPSIVPLTMAFIGYPDEHPEPRTQYLEEAVHWQTYDAARPRAKRPNTVIDAS